MVDDDRDAVQSVASVTVSTPPTSVQFSSFILAPPVASLFAVALSTHFLRLSPSSTFIALHTIRTVAPSAASHPSPPLSLFRWTRVPSSTLTGAAAEADVVVCSRSDDVLELPALMWAMEALQVPSLLVALVDSALSVTVLRVRPSIRPTAHHQLTKRAAPPTPTLHPP